MKDELIRSTNLERLLQLIHAEGMEKAQTEANHLLASAKEEAQRLLDNAKQEARKMHQEAELHLKRSEAAQTERLSMAARDLLLQLSEQLTQGFKRFVQTEVEARLTPELIASFLTSLAQAPQSQKPLDLLVPHKDLEAIEAALQKAFGEKLVEEVRLQGSDKVSAGLLVQEEGADAFLDFSAAALAQRMTRYLSPRLRDLWEEATAPLEGSGGRP
ncbi:MAG: hypothetical protein RRB13_14630 [bacterium]|nr:hypothetical protein [bacterium]